MDRRYCRQIPRPPPGSHRPHTTDRIRSATCPSCRRASGRSAPARSSGLRPGRGDVVEHQRPGREVAVGERRLDHALARTEPVERASTSSTAPSRNSRPRLEPAVATASSRAMASLEAGAIRRLATWKSGLLLARLSLHSGRTY